MSGLTRSAADSRTRLLVLGAGPAGLAGAVTAAAAGLAVTVVDSGSSIGGQYYRQPAKRLHAGRPQALHHNWRHWVALRSRFEHHVAAGRIRHLPGHQVWFAEHMHDGYRVQAMLGADEKQPVTVHGDVLLLATGAYERLLPFPGWTLPGVVTAGGAQAMLKRALVLPGREVVVAGTGPLLLPVTAGLADAGAQVNALIESAGIRSLLRLAPALAGRPGKLAEAAGYANRLGRHRVPIHFGHTVIAAHGTRRVEAVTVAALDAAGRVRPGTEKLIRCDSLAIGYGLLPHLDLAGSLGARTEQRAGAATAVAVDAEQRTSVPGLWAAGEVTGIGGADLARVEGEIAGRSVAAWSRGPRRAWQDEDHVRSPAWTKAEGKRRRLGVFHAAMDAAYSSPADWVERLTPETTVCRCEEVAAGAVRTALREFGATDARALKLLTRAGMGWCQGRMCAPAVAGLLAEHGAGAGDIAAAIATRRPFADPVPLGVLAGLPEDDDEEDAADD